MSDEDSTVEFEQVNSKPRLDSAVTMCEILFVCLSSTICVYRTTKWFKPFVRGTFDTEKRKTVDPPPAGGVRGQNRKKECRKIVTKCEGSL